MWIACKIEHAHFIEDQIISTIPTCQGKMKHKVEGHPWSCMKREVLLEALK
jgi:hypothetical protein